VLEIVLIPGDSTGKESFEKETLYSSPLDVNLDFQQLLKRNC
jgi:hypothetical protein